MKKNALLTLFITLSAGLGTLAQPIPPSEKLECDPSVRVGTLDNGLRYYIKQNKKPAGCADFRIITNVGAIQETKAQDGLAHFLEHMAFNGTKNLPNKELFTYFEANGAKFGANINAGTGTETTSYMLNNITLSREGVIDTSLLVLHDWLYYITLDPEEIDKERGVIIEEWRTRNGAGIRVYDQTRPVLYAGTKFATCNIIGTKENLESFKAQELVDFYKTWYRTDLQAIVIVGDIDLDQIEQKIKTRFSSIPKPTTPNPKQPIPPALNKEPAVKVITDKELTSSNVTLYIKSPALPLEKNELAISLYQNINKSLIYTMWDERFSDLSSRPNAPFLNAYAYFYNINTPTSALILSASFKDGTGAVAFKALLEEMEKSKRYGFTHAEFERAKTAMLRQLETSVANAASRQNSEFVQAYMNHFVSGLPYTTPQYNYDVVKKYLNTLSLETLNQTVSAAITDENRVVILSSPEKQDIVLPTEEQLLTAMTAVKSATIEAPKAEEANKPLMDASTITPGKIVKEKEDKFGTLLTLSNGAQVYVRSTKLREDEISFLSFAMGGNSIVATNDLPSIDGNIFYSYLSNAGLASFTATDLKKILTGKVANISPYISGFEHGFRGSASPKDIETLLQLLYLQTTQPRFEPSEFEVGMSSLRSIIPNLAKDPSWQMNIAMNQLLYNNHPRQQITSQSTLELANLNTLEKVYRKLLGQANGMTYQFVGNIDLPTLRPLIERYIASLPTGKRTKEKDTGVREVSGNVRKQIEVEMKTPKTTVWQRYTYKAPFNNHTMLHVNALSMALRIIYTETIREKEGGTYGVSVSGGVSKRPISQGTLNIRFDTDPAKAPKLAQITVDELKKVAKEGISNELLTKVKEGLAKQFKNEWCIYNSYWSAVINEWMRDGIDSPTEYIKRVEMLTNESIRKYAADIVAQNNFVELITNPKQ